MSSVSSAPWDSLAVNEDTVVTLGNFDGVHLGHVEILKQLKAQSELLNLKPVVITYAPHPRHYFSGEQIELLTTPIEKQKRLHSLGFTEIYTLEFNLELSQLSPLDFYQKFLRERMRAQAIVLGNNHRFGKNAAGDAQFLKKQLGENSGRLTVVNPIKISGETVCSTLIRKKLMRGDPATAQELLGYPFTYSGEVVKGEGRGHKLGFPTANISVASKEKLKVAHGVYGGFVWVDGEKLAGIVNIGKKPTFKAQKTQIEVHILDFSRNIYGKNIHLELHFFLRNEKLFKSGEELSLQIHSDLREYKQILTRRTQVDFKE